MSESVDLRAPEARDSRRNLTVEAVVITAEGTIGRVGLPEPMILPVGAPSLREAVGQDAGVFPQLMPIADPLAGGASDARRSAFRCLTGSPWEARPCDS